MFSRAWESWESKALEFSWQELASCMPVEKIFKKHGQNSIVTLQMPNEIVFNIFAIVSNRRSNLCINFHWRKNVTIELRKFSVTTPL